MYDVFSLPPIRFPEGFLWGSATAGHQIEGDNIHSQAWHQEQLPDFYQEDPERKIRAPSGKACDHYRLYREDVELMLQLGPPGLPHVDRVEPDRAPGRAVGSGGHGALP